MIDSNYLSSVKKQFIQYKTLGEKAIEQVPEDKINWQYNEETNSVAIIVRHMAGNMLSRFTDFFTSDGEKKSRNRDAEFENEVLSKKETQNRWNEGWACFFNILNNLSTEDLFRTVLIRNEEHTVMEALNRQLTHYASHVGQIIFLGKMICGSNWKSLSIPKGASGQFNTAKGL
jgi:hypothetical protein